MCNKQIWQIRDIEIWQFDGLAWTQKKKKTSICIEFDCHLNIGLSFRCCKDATSCWFIENCQRNQLSHQKAHRSILGRVERFWGTVCQSYRKDHRRSITEQCPVISERDSDANDKQTNHSLSRITSPQGVLTCYDKYYGGLYPGA